MLSLTTKSPNKLLIAAIAFFSVAITDSKADKDFVYQSLETASTFFGNIQSKLQRETSSYYSWLENFSLAGHLSSATEYFSDSSNSVILFSNEAATSLWNYIILVFDFITLSFLDLYEGKFPRGLQHLSSDDLWKPVACIVAAIFAVAIAIHAPMKEPVRKPSQFGAGFGHDSTPISDDAKYSTKDLSDVDDLLATLRKKREQRLLARQSSMNKSIDVDDEISVSSKRSTKLINPSTLSSSIPTPNKVSQTSPSKASFKKASSKSKASSKQSTPTKRSNKENGEEETETDIDRPRSTRGSAKKVSSKKTLPKSPDNSPDTNRKYTEEYLNSLTVKGKGNSKGIDDILKDLKISQSNGTKADKIKQILNMNN